MGTITKQLSDERRRLTDELMDLVNNSPWDEASRQRMAEIRTRLQEIHSENEARFSKTREELLETLKKIGI